MEPLIRILEVLAAHRVQFVVIGNLGARIQGAPVGTEDADIVYDRGEENLTRMMAALKELDAHIRTSDEPVPLPKHDPLILLGTPMWNLITVYGDLDLLHSPAGGGYDELIGRAVAIDIGYGTIALAASMDDIIASKEEANREKDHRSLPRLRQFRDQQLSRRARGGD